MDIHWLLKPDYPSTQEEQEIQARPQDNTPRRKPVIFLSKAYFKAFWHHSEDAVPSLLRSAQVRAATSLPTPWTRLQPSFLHTPALLQPATEPREKSQINEFSARWMILAYKPTTQSAAWATHTGKTMAALRLFWPSSNHRILLSFSLTQP